MTLADRVALDDLEAIIREDLHVCLASIALPHEEVGRLAARLARIMTNPRVQEALKELCQ